MDVVCVGCQISRQVGSCMEFGWSSKIEGGAGEAKLEAIDTFKRWQIMNPVAIHGELLNIDAACYHIKQVKDDHLKSTGAFLHRERRDLLFYQWCWLSALPYVHIGSACCWGTHCHLTKYPHWRIKFASPSL